MLNRSIGFVLFACSCLSVLCAVEAIAKLPLPPQYYPAIGYQEWRSSGEYPKVLVLPIGDTRYDHVVLRHPRNSPHKNPPQRMPFVLTREQPKKMVPWTKRPLLLKFPSTTNFYAKTTSLCDAEGSTYELVKGNVFPVFDQVLAVEKIELNSATLGGDSIGLPQISGIC